MSARVSKSLRDAAAINFLVQPTVVETLLECVKELSGIAHSLKQDNAVGSQRVDISSRLKEVAELLFAQATSTLDHRTLEHCVNRLRNIRSILKYLGNREDYGFRVHSVLMAIKHEMNT